MREQPFFEYLTATYVSRRTGRHLEARAARDAVSRCSRVEHAVNVNLDTLLRRSDVISVLKLVTASENRFFFSGDSRQGIAQLRSSVKLYAAFFHGESQKHRTRNFYPGRFPS